MQRHAKAYGYFFGERFAKASDPREITDEIALNLTYLEAVVPSTLGCSDRQACDMQVLMFGVCGLKLHLGVMHSRVSLMHWAYIECFSPIEKSKFVTDRNDPERGD